MLAAPPRELCHLHYGLTRRQRWDVHVGAWLPALPRYLVVVAIMVPLIWAASLRSPWYLLFSLAPLWVLRGFIAGFLNIALVPVQRMDVIINELAVGVLAGSQRWWVFLDGIVAIAKFRDDLWSFTGYHGQMIDVPAALIGEETLAHVRARSEWGGTPEGVQAAIQRGRMRLGLRPTGDGATNPPSDGQGKPDD
ncbi:MAG TPA: hypothetical protein VJM14_17885 [Burkholderiales bacterium]|jgi:hypothetical protein|nr:hypothetical protein [Burkholderiales bacterium]